MQRSECFSNGLEAVHVRFGEGAEIDFAGLTDVRAHIKYGVDVESGQ